VGGLALGEAAAIRVIIAPIGFLHTSMYIADWKLPRRVAWFFYSLHAVFIVFAQHGLVHHRRPADTYGFWSVPGPLFLGLFGFPISRSCSARFVVLYRAQRSAQRLARKRIRTMLLASMCIWPAGTNDLLPILGFDYYPLLGKPFLPGWRHGPQCIYMTIVAYSVLQHSLLDVHVALSRFARTSCVSHSWGLIGLCLLLILNAIAPREFSSFAFYGSLATLIASAIFASILFPPAARRRRRNFRTAPARRPFSSIRIRSAISSKA
jgi:hypothetical protein